MSRIAALALAALLALPVAAHAQEDVNTQMTPASEGLYRAKLGVGAFDIGDDDRSTNFRAEIHTNDMWWVLHPFAAVDVNTDGGVWGGVGVAADLELTPQLIATPSFAPGLYSEGDSKDLGGALEFRSAIELAYKFQNAHRIGIELDHKSNAGIYDKNPGEETVSLNWHVPINF